MRMGSTTLGALNEFDETRGDWVEYVERLEHFFKAIEIDMEDKKKSIIQSSCGRRTYELFRSLLMPVKPRDTSWKDLKEIRESHQKSVGYNGKIQVEQKGS